MHVSAYGLLPQEDQPGMLRHMGIWVHMYSGHGGGLEKMACLISTLSKDSSEKSLAYFSL